MSRDDSSVDKLRGAFASLEGGPPEGEPCPQPDEIWAAVHGELPPERAQALVRHTAVCGDCASDWRVAMQSQGAEAESEPRPSTRSTYRWFAAAAAAVLVVVAALVVREEMFAPPEPTFRSTEETEIRSLVSEAEALPRDEVVLRWSSVGESAVYSIDVATQDLTPVLSKHNLTETELTIPPDLLSGLPTGETLIWKVEARLPDGRFVVSAAFLTRIQ